MFSRPERDMLKEDRSLIRRVRQKICTNAAARPQYIVNSPRCGSYLMPAQAITCVIQRLRRSMLHDDPAERTDTQLLAAFLARDETAFNVLLHRHGRMVLGVCRRVLGNGPDAEDAFQASFLVLLRKAASLRQRELLGNWLYGVAYRTALEAKAARARRRAKEAAMRDRPRPQTDADDPWSELRPCVDQELERLPEKYRVPIVLCDLEGKTRKEAAQLLGWPEGTVSGRLARARRMLATRLARHGLTLSAAALAAELAHSTAAEVSRTLALSTYKTIAAVSAGQAATSASAAALAQGVLTTMLLRKVKMVATCFCLVAIAGLCAVQVLGETRDARSSSRTGHPVARHGEVQFIVAQEAQHAKRKPQIYVGAVLMVKRAGEDEAQRYSGIIAIDPDTGKWRKVTGAGAGPRVSPDRETVIFTKHAGAGDGVVDSEVWNCDTAGSDNPGKITGLGGMAAWSPDGKHLVIGKSKFENDALATHTWRVDADGRNAKELPIPKTDEVNDWSRDGKWFVTVSDRHPPHGSGYQLYLMHPDGTGERRLTKNGLNCYPRFSPDSRSVVYCHQTGKEGTSVWVVDIDGKNARPIIKEEDLVAAEFGCWSPDGKRLAVIRFKWERDENGRRVISNPADADYHIVITDTDGRNRRRLQLADATITWLGHADWR